MLFRSLIREGKVLVIPTGPGSGRAVAQANPRANRQGGGKNTRSRTHTVRAGESLWTIARRYDTRVKNLAAANNLSRRSTLKPGQRLTIPGSGRFVAASAPAAKVAKVYTVRAGDSLWSIAQRLGVRVAQLTSWNNLSAKATLRPGQRLTVFPGGRSG